MAFPNYYRARPWAIRAASGHTTDRKTIMETDPSKFALSASSSLLSQIQGAHHATEYHNLKAIMEEGIKAGRDLMGNHGSSGRLHSCWGVFPPRDKRNKITRTRSSVDRWLPLVTLYIPTIDLIRAGGKVTESGVILCSRPIPFRLVKEVWICLPSSERGQPFEQVEKILDYELEDELCMEVKRTPVPDSMKSYRTLARLLQLLCDMQSGPHDAMRETYINRLSENCGASWNEVDWDRYEGLYKEATEFLFIHTPPPRNARTSRDTELRYRYCPWCLSNIPSCLSRCVQCFSTLISFGKHQRVSGREETPMEICQEEIAQAVEEAAAAPVEEDDVPMEDEPQPEADHIDDVPMDDGGNEDTRTVGEPEMELDADEDTGEDPEDVSSRQPVLLFDTEFHVDQALAHVK